MSENDATAAHGMLEEIAGIITNEATPENMAKILDALRILAQLAIAIARIVR